MFDELARRLRAAADSSFWKSARERAALRHAEATLDELRRLNSAVTTYLDARRTHGETDDKERIEADIALLSARINSWVHLADVAYTETSTAIENSAS